ncbi:N-acetylglucosamine kinase [Paenibacillus sp. GXUN7292]|uniref:N-acetylglucosamine kinase n=1 Tax=Paenibacillus sp. GXUN7292 TaxID=3422499 RepID=UPI003D7D1B8D
MSYVIGIDGGGTKTEVVIADLELTELHRFSAGAINLNGKSEAGVQQSFQDIASQMISRNMDWADCKYAAIGAAGISNPLVKAQLEKFVREMGYTGPLTIVGDQVTALYGAHRAGKGSSGVILIAGTGSICFGKSKSGSMHRVGGFGYLLDDEGSGYSIGRDILSAVLQASDGRAEPTIFQQLVFEKLQLSTIQEIVGFVYAPSTSKGDIAAIAPLLSTALDAHDHAALKIADKSAASLVELVIPIMNQFGAEEGAPIAFAGSVLLKNNRIQKAVVEQLRMHYPQILCYPAKQDAAFGAVLLAAEQLNINQG